MFRIDLLKYEYGNPIPVECKLETRYDTIEAVTCAMYHMVIEEISDLNSALEDGTFPERRFTAQLNHEVYDAVIVCWDGDDYSNVTCYSIVEMK